MEKIAAALSIDSETSLSPDPHQHREKFTETTQMTQPSAQSHRRPEGRRVEDIHPGCSLRALFCVAAACPSRAKRSRQGELTASERVAVEPGGSCGGVLAKGDETTLIGGVR